MFVLYNLLVWLTLPLWVPWMILRSRRRHGAVNWRQRTGNYPFTMTKGSRRIWIHAVSVGEVVAALPVLREIRKLAPDAEIVLSTTTSSGHQTAQDKAADLVTHVVYFPIDLPAFTLSALARVRPQVVAIMETELWMNFLWACKEVNAKTMVINGRLSDRSFPRAKKVAFFYRALFRWVDKVLVQTGTDAERMLAIGASQPEVLGNVKFDEATAGLEADPARWRQTLGLDDSRPTIIVGSTRGEMEETFVHQALLELDQTHHDQYNLIWAPRHIESSENLARTARAGRRSQGAQGPRLILDTFGELSEIYSVADVVVIGGAFDKLGGQNLIQPLAHGKPVIHGPHMENFRAPADLAARAAATLVADSPSALATHLRELLTNETRRKDMGERARKVVAEHIGASRRYAERIVVNLPELKSVNTPTSGKKKGRR
jgi:3-deoxy-D-manno-octulosonic-acid transferase